MFWLALSKTIPFHPRNRFQIGCGWEAFSLHFQLCWAKALLGTKILEESDQTVKGRRQKEFKQDHSGSEPCRACVQRRHLPLSPSPFQVPTRCKVRDASSRGKRGWNPEVERDSRGRQRSGGAARVGGPQQRWWKRMRWEKLAGEHQSVWRPGPGPRRERGFARSRTVREKRERGLARSREAQTQRGCACPRAARGPVPKPEPTWPRRQRRPEVRTTAQRRLLRARAPAHKRSGSLGRTHASRPALWSQSLAAGHRPVHLLDSKECRSLAWFWLV